MRSEGLSMSSILHTVYFDTNIFDHLHKGICVTPADVQFLKQRVSDGRLSILLSMINLEEVLMAVPTHRALALAELQLMEDLVDFTHIIKPFQELLTEDITAYARGTTLPSLLIAFPRAARETLQRLLNPYTTGMQELSEETREHIDAYRTRSRQGVDIVRQVADQIPRRAQPTFEAYWQALSTSFAEAYAERAGQLPACRARGIDGLLQLRSVRLSVSASLSLTYAETFEERQPQQGDARDMQHALTASPVRVFVTHDTKFARLLKRVPVSDFSVLTLPEFLASIRPN
jgi:predicted nucleic acid-binding protein